MSDTIFINKVIAINRLSDGALLIDNSSRLIVLNQELLLVIVQYLLDGPVDEMYLITVFSEKYAPMDIMRSINTLKHYKVIVGENWVEKGFLYHDNMDKGFKTVSDAAFNYIGDADLVKSFREGSNLLEHSEFTVVLTRDFLDKSLGNTHDRLLSEGKPFIIAKVYGEELLISPVVESSGGPCWHCITYRMKLNHPTYALKKSSVVLQKAEEKFHFQVIPAVNSVLKEASLKVGGLEKTGGYLVKLDLVNGKTSYHPVQHRPQCPCCGDSNLETNYLALPLFSEDSEISGYSGGYRTISAEQTYKNFEHLIDPLTGVMPSVDEYRKVQGAPIFNYSSGRNIALRSRSMFWLNNHMRSSSGGKGKSEQQAKTGALCESIERYSMVFHGQAPCVTSSYIELGTQAIEPNKCMNFSRNQTAERQAINAQCTAFHSLVPVEFNKKAQVDWSSVHSLTDEKIYYLPSEFCFAQYPADDETQLIAYPDSNGCASGNNYAEAILQGSLELIERDAVAIWWYNRIQRPEVDLSSLNNNYIKTVCKYYESINRTLYVLDITTDMGIPCFVAVSYNKVTDKEILYGFGCHMDANIAVERAVIELNQLLPIVLTKRPEKFDVHMASWLDQNEIQLHAYLSPKPIQKISIEETYKASNFTNINSAVKQLIGCFKKAEINLLMLDLTQPDIGMPVVKMVAPSLRHFWRRLAPGRLFDVPVKIGWRKSPMTEEEVNPLSIVI